MTVYCLKYGVLKKHLTRIADIPLSACWVEGSYAQSDRFISDLNPEDELFIFSSKRALTFNRSGLKCKVSIMIAEPEIIQKQFYHLISFFQRRFYRIATHSDNILAKCKNAEKWTHGGRWIEFDTPQLFEKTGMVSIIASKQRSSEGHLLRHELISWAQQKGVVLDLFGKGYNWLEKKSNGHAPYRFSVIIENSRSSGYFTEKLIDCLLCESVPIYWGDPKIADHFDLRGFLICDDLKDLQRALENLDTRLFEELHPYLVKNKKRALTLFDQPNSMTQLAGPKIFDFT
jgi:hypothetical protein